MYIKFAKIEVKQSGNLTSKNSFIRHTFLNGTADSFRPSHKPNTSLCPSFRKPTAI